LAAATAIPVIGLLSDGQGWKQTAPRCRTVLTFTAGDWLGHVDAFDAAMLGIVEAHRACRVFHAYEVHGSPDDRAARAQATGAATGWVPAPYGPAYSRDARGIGDERALPYLKDVLAHALQSASDRDLVVFTNDDIGLPPGIDAIIRDRLSKAVMLTGRRTDASDPGHVGRDLVAFQAGWLRLNLAQIPDFILGAPAWDLWMAREARRLCGVAWTIATSASECLMCELPSGTVLHEAHVAHWAGHQESPACRWNTERAK
jgi:hypothetical protein